MNTEFESQTRNFNYLTVSKDKKFIVKKSSFASKFFDEINWLISVPNNIKPFIPEVVDYSLDPKKLFVKYKFIKLDTVHNYFVGDKEYSAESWKNFFNQLDLLFQSFKNVKPKELVLSYWKQNFKFMYLNKTIQRLENIKKNKKFHFFFQNDSIKIHNKTYPSLKAIICFLKEIESGSNKKSFFNEILKPVKNNICLFHGDTCFSNIFSNSFLTKKNSAPELKIIDARGSFGEDKIFGDVLHDYAKICESVFGLYDFVLEGKTEVKLTKQQIKYKIFSNKNVVNAQKAISNFLPQKYLKHIELIESLMFLTMIEFHSDHFDHQLIFLCIGIIKFYEVLKPEWKL